MGLLWLLVKVHTDLDYNLDLAAPEKPPLSITEQPPRRKGSETLPCRKVRNPYTCSFLP